MRNRFHFYIGAITFVAFIFTGLYMRLGLHHLKTDDVTHRMMFRANHIYILFTSLLNFSIAFFKRSNLKRLETLASFFILIATLGVVVSFFMDPQTGNIQRDITRFSVIGLSIGFLIQLLILKYNANKESKNQEILSTNTVNRYYSE